jgi:hypothetical protein
MEARFQKDMVVLQRIAAVPTILDLVCGTDMGSAAVARVPSDRLIARQVLNKVHLAVALQAQD